MTPCYHAIPAECPSQQLLTDQGDGGSNSHPRLVQNVSATSLYHGFGVEKIFSFEYPINMSSTNAWCSGMTVSSSFPNVTITMTEPVLLHALLSGGYISNNFYHRVTSFSLEYSETAGGDMILYQHQGNMVIS